LEFCTDTSAAGWLRQFDVPWGQLVGWGVPGFERYGRLRYIPDPTFPGQSENDVHVPEGHPSELAQVKRLLRVLADFTQTPDECFFLLWEGYGVPLPAGAELFSLPTHVRAYAVLQGAAGDLDGWSQALQMNAGWAPAFIWPADHAWLVASDVDPHWAGVGASDRAIRAILAETALDFVTGEYGSDVPEYR
jgi:hypothetical protein